MLWPRFQVKGMYAGTNRKRTITVQASSLESCRLKALDNGLLEPLEITELEPNPPSERQVEYAKDIGINVNNNMCFEDISALLNRHENDDKNDPNPGLKEYANGKHFNFSEYIGKKALYNLVFDNLYDIDRVAFFTFCIYRWLSDDRRANLDDHPHRDIFYRIAEVLYSDDKFIKSMEKYSGESIRFFGELHINNYSYYGGSTNTKAYKAAAELICKEFELHNINKRVINNDKNREPISKSNEYPNTKPKEGWLSKILRSLKK